MIPKSSRHTHYYYKRSRAKPASDDEATASYYTVLKASRKKAGYIQKVNLAKARHSLDRAFASPNAVGVSDFHFLRSVRRACTPVEGALSSSTAAYYAVYGSGAGT